MTDCCFQENLSSEVRSKTMIYFENLSRNDAASERSLAKFTASTEIRGHPLCSPPSLTVIFEGGVDFHILPSLPHPRTIPMGRLDSQVEEGAYRVLCSESAVDSRFEKQS
ncbi:hypothetical protein AVEN_91502-1 [Araneus ventricosus]|uniref:Uncharacterized protein n=1 Tax=Araneus ventricosus TaxID=182803 RepID=A0A4Y2BLU0_ARAVE|nr:hypothetical protein AVEN_91502-1 [Araneus ventricosus]